MFAVVGGLMFALDDLLVDLIYFARAGWRWLTVYTRHPRAFADALRPPDSPGTLAVCNDAAPARPGRAGGEQRSGS